MGIRCYALDPKPYLLPSPFYANYRSVISHRGSGCDPGHRFRVEVLVLIFVGFDGLGLGIHLQTGTLPHISQTPQSSDTFSIQAPSTTKLFTLHSRLLGNRRAPNPAA